MKNNGTVLRFLKVNNPEALSSALGLLPFKVEIKQIIHTGKSVTCWFTLDDQYYRITNDQLKALSHG